MTSKEHTLSILARIGVTTSKLLDNCLVVYVFDSANRFKIVHGDYVLLTYKCEDSGVATIQLYTDSTLPMDEKVTISFNDIQNTLCLPFRFKRLTYNGMTVGCYSVMNSDGTFKHSFLSQRSQAYMYRAFTSQKVSVINNYLKTNYVKDNIPLIITRTKVVSKDQAGKFSPDEELQKELTRP